MVNSEPGVRQMCLSEQVLDPLFTTICFDASFLHYPSDEKFGFDQASPRLSVIPGT